jgi:SAM-dependent methyltransferase
VVFGLPLLLCYLASHQPWRFGLALGAILLASPAYLAVHGTTLHAERNFFGALKVTRDPAARFHRLYHGTTLHGLQFIAPERQGEPLAYFHRAGPCGQFMTAFNLRSNASRVAVIGLGAGTLAAYAQPGQQWTFYEIDPAIVRLAQATNWFTYLQRCHSVRTRFELGDARLRLREAAPRQYDLIVADAFGSDVPPLHLLTREALDLYLSKLASNGLLLFQVSSRYFDFRPVLGNLAAHFQLQAYACFETEVSQAEAAEGRCASFWVALARRSEDLGPLLRDHRWRPIPPAPHQRLWTDDYSNILNILHWFD